MRVMKVSALAFSDIHNTQQNARWSRHNPLWVLQWTFREENHYLPCQKQNMVSYTCCQSQHQILFTSSFQFNLSVVSDYDCMDCSTPGLPVHHQLLESTQTHVHWVSDAIQPPHPLSSPLLLPSILPSIRVFSNESVFRIRWPKYWNFSFSISPSNEYSGLISFRMDWLDLLAVQGTLKSLLQKHLKKKMLAFLKNM